MSFTFAMYMFLKPPIIRFLKRISVAENIYTSNVMREYSDKKKRPPKRTLNIDRRILDPIYVVVILAIWEDKLQSVQQPDPAQFCGS